MMISFAYRGVFVAVGLLALVLLVLLFVAVRSRRGSASIHAAPAPMSSTNGRGNLSPEEAYELALERMAKENKDSGDAARSLPSSRGRDTDRGRSRTISDPMAVSPNAPSPWDALGRPVPVQETYLGASPPQDYQDWKNVKVGGRGKGVAKARGDARDTFDGKAAGSASAEAQRDELRHSSFSQPIPDGELFGDKERRYRIYVLSLFLASASCPWNTSFYTPTSSAADGHSSFVPCIVY